MAKRNTAGALLLVVAGVASPVSAQVTIPEEYDKTVKSAQVVGTLGPDLFGDATSLYTGATTFTATDVSLPGNDALPVAIGRRFIVQSREASERNALLTRDGGFADWELDIPHMRGVFAKNKGWQVDSWSESGKNLRCSLAEANQAEPPTVPGAMSGFVEGFQYWNGNTLYVPGMGDQEMLVADANANPHRPTDGKTYRWVTNNQWYVSCLPATANGVPGDAFLAVAPDGTRYHFDWFATRHASTLRASGTSLAREEVWILPTRAEDRFGNWVSYAYDPARPWHLTSISASDGRRLTLTYDGNWISTVSDGSRTWRYVYGNGLTEVVLPDQSKWTINFATLREAYTRPGNAATARCSEQTANPDQSTYTGTIVHPSGAVGEFGFRSQMHGRSYVPKSCPGTPSTMEGFIAYNPFYFEVVGITSKKVTGLGLAPMQWTYAFGPSNRSWAEQCTDGSCPSTKTLEVTGPGEYHRYTFGNRWRVSDGKLLLTETGAGPTDILRTEANIWQLDPSGQAYPAVIGRAAYVRGDGTATKHTPLLRRTITQQGSTFEWRAESFDAFARPLRTTRASSLGHTRTDTTTYADNLSRWVVGQVAASANIDTGLVESRTEFDPETALPVASYAFGLLQQQRTYHADGTLATITDANGHTTAYTQWKRGIPQTVKAPPIPEAPGGVTTTVVVNDSGWITASTDRAGAKTCYEHDAMGRTSKIIYPSETQPGACDTSASMPTTITFTAGHPAVYGMPAGHWRQTTHTGNGREVVVFDALWRPVVEQTLDLGNVEESRREVFKRYDAAGRPVFESYPIRNAQAQYVDTTLQGTHTTFDALGRPVRIAQDAEYGPLVTTIDYLHGGHTRATDPRGQQTTTYYRSYDAPSDALPIRIEHPEGKVTEIERDVFGDPTRMTQSGGGQ